ncbi:hypothetical protein ACFT2C_05500 [Promicromonospora sp. NPDC057138]|uniref:hypothetical protein n=1 Tax=Promicromonospora sp. NPDC057138 TaxID=3346031 RepID=UPI00362F65B9
MTRFDKVRRYRTAAGLVLLVALAGCGGDPPSTHTGTPSAPSASDSASPTPQDSASPSPGDAASMSNPADLSGDWTQVAAAGLGQESDGTGNGQYIALLAQTVNFTESGGTTSETAVGPLSCPGLTETLAKDTVIATFHEAGAGTYEGEAAIWDVTHSSCSFDHWTGISVTNDDGGLQFTDGGPSLTMTSTDPLAVPIRIVFHRYVGGPPTP